MNIPLQEAGEIIEHIGRKRKCKAVDVRLVLTCCQDSYDRNESFKDDRDDEHRATEGRDEARAFHKIPYPSAMHSDPPGPDFFRCPGRFSGQVEDRLYPFQTDTGGS